MAAAVEIEPERRAGDGGAGALDELFRSHRRGLVGLAVVLTGDPDVADDLVQDAFVRLGRRPPNRWPTPGAELAYLRRTVVNLSHSAARRRAVARRHLRSERDDAGDVTSPAGMARSRQRRIAAAVRALPARQRDCVVLHYYADLPDSEIAATLGVAAGTVKSALHRARASLSATLGDLR